MTAHDTGKNPAAKQNVKLGLMGAALLAVDQITKFWAVDALNGVVHAVTPFFNLILVWNRGISFGLFQQDRSEVTGTYLLIAMALLITVVMFVWLTRTRRPVQQYAIAGVIAGALGNVIDRMQYGAVVDFLDFHVLGYHWPAFNIADCCVVVGIAILMVDSLFFEPKDQSAPTNKTE